MVKRALFLIVALSVVGCLAGAQDFCVRDPTTSGTACKDPSLVQEEDFLFSGLHLPGDATSNRLKFNVTAVTVAQIPGLNTLGLSIARIDFGPQGGVPPHVHPTATEMFTVVQGIFVVGFVTSDPEHRLFARSLRKGDVFVFPAGVIHFVRNVKYERAVGISAFNSENPRTTTIADAAFGSYLPIGDGILGPAFQIDSNLVFEIQAKFNNQSKF